MSWLGIAVLFLMAPLSVVVLWRSSVQWRAEAGARRTVPLLGFVIGGWMAPVGFSFWAIMAIGVLGGSGD